MRNTHVMSYYRPSRILLFNIATIISYWIGANPTKHDGEFSGIRFQWSVVYMRNVEAFVLSLTSARTAVRPRLRSLLFTS